MYSVCRIIDTVHTTQYTDQYCIMGYIKFNCNAIPEFDWQSPCHVNDCLYPIGFYSFYRLKLRGLEPFAMIPLGYCKCVT